MHTNDSIVTNAAGGADIPREGSLLSASIIITSSAIDAAAGNDDDVADDVADALEASMGISTQ